MVDAARLAAIRARLSWRDGGTAGAPGMPLQDAFRLWLATVDTDMADLAAFAEAVVPILRMLADTPVDTSGAGSMVCQCAYREAHPTEHAPDCPCAIARRLVGSPHYPAAAAAAAAAAAQTEGSAGSVRE